MHVCYLMENRSMKGFKKRLGQLTENRLAQWLISTSCPYILHLTTCHSRCQTHNGSYHAGFGSLLPGICCWPQLGQDVGWFLCSSPPSLGAVGMLSLPAAVSGMSCYALGRDRRGIWAVPLGADALCSFVWWYMFLLQYCHRSSLG